MPPRHNGQTKLRVLQVPAVVRRSSLFLLPEMDNREAKFPSPVRGTVKSILSRQRMRDDEKIALDVDSWVVDVDYKLQQTKPTYDSGRSWTIHRVPRNLGHVQENAFIPKIISIGPFHHGGKGLELMEEHKKRFLMRLLGGKLDESEDDNRSLSSAAACDDQERKDTPRLGDLVEAMRELEKRARKCYSENLDKTISSDEFVLMMVLDGSFVVELLRLYYDFNEAKRTLKESFSAHEERLAPDPIFNTRWMLRSLQRDLLMLENQLPYFVLEKLFELTRKGQDQMELEKLIVTFFDPLSPRETATSQLNRALTADGQKQQYAHMLDVFRSTFLKTVREKVNRPVPHIHENKSFLSSHYNRVEKPRPREKQLIHFMSELQEAGVALEKRECDDLLDIAFKDGTLHMSPFFIDNNSVPLFLNFVAYEQCDERAKPYFTNYFMFLDSLINSSDDVRILHERGVINHVLGSTDNVAKLLNQLCREIVYDNDQCYLSDEMKAANEHCERYYRSKCRRWWRNLIRNYFSSPWAFLSLLAAVILLMLTVLQTFYTVYPYYRPPS